MSWKIKWHCEGGHDFEVETELKVERCPKCGGTDIIRIEEPSKVERFFKGSGKASKSRWWR